MNIEYVTQKCVPVADCLSRLINPNNAQEDESLDLQISDLGTTTYEHQTHVHV